MDNVVPKLDSEVAITSFNGDEYLIEHKLLGYQVNISENTYRIIQLVDGKRTIIEIAKAFEGLHSMAVSSELIFDVLFKKLAKYGIVKQDGLAIERRGKPDYLRLSFIIIPSKLVDAVVPVFKILFHKWIFYPLLVMAGLFITLTVSLNFDSIAFELKNGDLTLLSMALYVTLFQVGNIFHEFGHAAALRKFGLKTGGIGFGFYLITPALYTDVSEAWKLSIDKRVIVNLGGIYFEMILCIVCMSVYLFQENIVFLIMPCILAIRTLINLNPFLKLDGYWILSDVTKTPNLRKLSMTVLKDKLSDIYHLRFTFKSKKEGLLFLYALTSIGFIIIFVGTVLIKDPYSLLVFPAYVLDVILYSKGFSFNLLGSLFIPLVFWYLIFNLIRLAFREFRKKRSLSG